MNISKRKTKEMNLDIPVDARDIWYFDVTSTSETHSEVIPVAPFVNLTQNKNLSGADNTILVPCAEADEVLLLSGVEMPGDKTMPEPNRIFFDFFNALGFDLDYQREQIWGAGVEKSDMYVRYLRLYDANIDRFVFQKEDINKRELHNKTCDDIVFRATDADEKLLDTFQSSTVRQGHSTGPMLPQHLKLKHVIDLAGLFRRKFDTRVSNIDPKYLDLVTGFDKSI